MPSITRHNRRCGEIRSRRKGNGREAAGREWRIEGISFGSGGNQRRGSEWAASVSGRGADISSVLCVGGDAAA
jgi:hypothetical protein